MCLFVSLISLFFHASLYLSLPASDRYFHTYEWKNVFFSCFSSPLHLFIWRSSQCTMKARFKIFTPCFLLQYLIGAPILDGSIEMSFQWYFRSISYSKHMLLWVKTYYTTMNASFFSTSSLYGKGALNFCSIVPSSHYTIEPDLVELKTTLIIRMMLVQSFLWKGRCCQYSFEKEK